MDDGVLVMCRLISVVESMDNGKPIRESRDLDIPLVARHFYHHAGNVPLTMVYSLCHSQCTNITAYYNFLNLEFYHSQAGPN